MTLCFSHFFPSLFTHVLTRIKLNFYQHDFIKVLNSYPKCILPFSVVKARDSH